MRARISIAVLFIAMVGCSGAPVRDVARPAASVAIATTPAVVNLRDDGAQQQYNAALAAMRKGDDAAAETLLQRVAQVQPGWSGVYLNLGIIYQRSQRLPQAEEALMKALTLNPDNVYAHNQLGMVYRILGRFDEARTAYHNALEIDPRYAKAHLNLAILSDIYLHDGPEAIAHYRRYQELTKNADKIVEAWIADVQKRTKEGTDTEDSTTGKEHK